jgi:hypothetical protein
MWLCLFGTAGPTDIDLGLTTLTSFVLHTIHRGLLRPTASHTRGVPTQRTENPRRRRRIPTAIAAEAPEQRGVKARIVGSSRIPSSRNRHRPRRATGGEGDDAEADPVQGPEQEEDRPSQPPRQGAPRSQRYARRDRLRRPHVLDWDWLCVFALHC